MPAGAPRGATREPSMCGILGGLTAEPFEFLRDERWQRAIDCLAHRGPDDRGWLIWPDRRAFLGHRRLSIIDLAGGHQPIADETGERHLCYNGEVYNFRGLRRELAARGHVLRTQTDGEPALHLYEEDPRGFVTRLSGMFALAVLDQAAGRLTLARDRLGIKPLYYTCDGARLLFASEPKAILMLLGRRPAVCPDGLRQYLRWKYIPAPLTIYAGLRELPPGHLLVAQRRPGQTAIDVSVERYWRLDFSGDKICDEREATEELDRRLRAAVESHLESDVEVGALLSGGVDSSLVVALAARLSKRPIQTFSVGFREPGFDQLPFARRLAEHCGTRHHEETIDVDPLTLIPRLVRHFDQPFADSSALACYRVCEVASRHVKVALTGDGGDESFAGYRRYEDLGQAAQMDGPWRRTASGALYSVGSVLFSPEAKFLRKLRAARLPPLRAYEESEVMCGDWLAQQLLGEAYRGSHGPDPFAERCREAETAGWPVVEAAQYADLCTYLPGDILAKVDRTSMACSLECRVPLLDHAVVELSAALPLDLKIREGTGKYILKRVAERYVPRELLYRKKRGFRVPIRRWFKGELLDQTAALLRGGVLVQHGILDRAGAEWVLNAQRRPWINLSSCLWALLMLEHWAQTYLDPQPT
jgi:asparagine synthase (glutamine-hydrolysing)